LHKLQTATLSDFSPPIQDNHVAEVLLYEIQAKQ